MVNHNKMGLLGAISYIIAIISMVGALIYVELGTSIQKSGAEFAYLCYVKWYPIAVAFMFVGCILTHPATTAIQSETFAEYIIQGLKIQFAEPYQNYLAKKLIAFSLIWLLMFLNFFSVKTFVQCFQILATIAKMVAMAIVIGTGFYFLIFKAETGNLQNMFHNSTWKPGKLVTALFAGLYSYDGWDILNYGAEEVENLRRTMPLAIVIGMTMIAIFYLAINLSYFVVLTVAQIETSDAVAVSFAQAKLASRYLHAAARHGNLPSFISCTNKFHDSPRAALFVQIILAMGFSFAGNLDQLISYVSFAAWSQRAFTMLALLYIRFWHLPVHPNAMRTPIILPILFFIICVGLVGVTIGQNFSEAAVGIFIIISGFLVFFMFMWDRALPSHEWYRRNASVANEKIAIVFQILFNGMIDLGGDEEESDENVQSSSVIANEKISIGIYDNVAMDRFGLASAVDVDSKKKF
uniref:Amino acid transporter n=1 Tax=Acrobeloides nanus TaxID=290746 RepID=A0A914D3E3_9BILA